jgi:hypothetical protein
MGFLIEIYGLFVWKPPIVEQFADFRAEAFGGALRQALPLIFFMTSGGEISSQRVPAVLKINHSIAQKDCRLQSLPLLEELVVTDGLSDGGGIARDLLSQRAYRGNCKVAVLSVNRVADRYIRMRKAGLRRLAETIEQPDPVGGWRPRTSGVRFASARQGRGSGLEMRLFAAWWETSAIPRFGWMPIPVGCA